MADNANENTVKKNLLGPRGKHVYYVFLGTEKHSQNIDVAGLFKSTQEPINCVVAQSAVASTYLVPLNTHVNITYTQNYEDNRWTSLQQIPGKQEQGECRGTAVRVKKKQAKAIVAQLDLHGSPQSGQGCKTEGDERSRHCLLSIQTAVLGKQLSSSRSTMHIKRFLL